LLQHLIENIYLFNAFLNICQTRKMLQLQVTQYIFHAGYSSRKDTPDGNWNNATGEYLEKINKLITYRAQSQVGSLSNACHSLAA
jgi:hypothetical protein